MTALRNVTWFFGDVAVLLRRVWALLVEFPSGRKNSLDYGDDEYLGLGKHRIIHIKGNGRLKYISIFKFENNRGAVVSMGGTTILDPWEIIPITFVAQRWFFEVAGEPEYVQYFGGGYGAYRGVISRLKAIQNEPAAPALEDKWDFEQRVPKDRQMYPLKWAQQNWALQFQMA